MNDILFYNLQTGFLIVREAVCCPRCRMMRYFLVNRNGVTTCASCAREREVCDA